MGDTQPTAVYVTVQHVPAERVRAADLTDRAGDDLVSLKLGDSNATVSVLGTLAELRAVVDAAAEQLERVTAARVPGGSGDE